MRPRELVIDDDKEIIRTVGDILNSLNHDHDPAGDQETARNDWQEWILEQLAQGVQLRHKDIIRHTKKSRSTINRGLKRLREVGLVETPADEYYARVTNDTLGATHAILRRSP